MSSENVLEKVFNFIHLNPLNPILILKIMLNYSQIKLFGSLMILMYTELQYIRHLKEILQPNLLTVLFSFTTLEMVNYI